jgi:hypothetical protein
MKKYIFILLILSSFNVFSQENIIKLGLSGISYGMYSLGYERAITPKSTLNLSLGYWNINASPFLNKNPFEIDQDIRLNNYKWGMNGVIDYRFYVSSQEGLKGLYIGPYLRYWNHSLVLNDSIDNEKFDVNLKFSSIGLGFQMGYQWIISDRISIDWYFIGLGVERIDTRFKYVTKTVGFDYSSIQDDIIDVFNDFKSLQKQIVTKSYPDNMTAKLPFFAPGIKTGFSIGYVF